MHGFVKHSVIADKNQQQPHSLQTWTSQAFTGALALNLTSIKDVLPV